VSGRKSVARGGAEDLQPLHAEAAADIRDRVAALFDQRVHGLVPAKDRSDFTISRLAAASP
jgi:hypothetical protein